MSKMETGQPNLINNTDYGNEDLQEVKDDTDHSQCGADHSQGDTDGVNLGMVGDQKSDTLSQDQTIARMLTYPVGEQTSDDETLVTEDIHTSVLTDSLNSDTCDITEISDTNMELLIDNLCCSDRESPLDNNGSLFENNARIDDIFLLRKDSLPSHDLLHNNILILPSDLSPDEDSEALPSHAPSPCSILPQEMDIISPTMTLSIAGEGCFFTTFFPENNTRNTNHSVPKSQHRIDQSTRNKTFPGKIGVVNFPSECDKLISEEIDPLNVGQNIDELISEKLFINQILQRINTYQPEDSSTELSGRNTDGCKDSHITSAGEKPQLSVDASGLNSHFGSYTTFQMEGGQMTKLSLFQFPSLNSSSSSSESLVREHGFMDSGLANLRNKTDLTKNKSPFWNRSIKGHYVKADTPTTSFEREDGTSNFEIGKVTDLPETDTAEQSMSCTETDKIEIINSSQLRECPEQVTGRKFEIHDEMLDIIKELRRLSIRNVDDVHDIGLKAQDVPDYLSDDNLSTKANYATSELHSEPIDLIPTTEVSETSELTNGACINVIDDENNGVLGKHSLLDNVLALWPKIKSCGVKVGVTTDDSEQEYLKESGIFSHGISTPFKLLPRVSIEHTNSIRYSNENTRKDICINETKTKKIAPDRGIFKAAKEKTEQSYPKRVSFRTENTVCGPENWFDRDFLSENINVDNVNTEIPVASRSTLNMDLLSIGPGEGYGGPLSVEMRRHQRFSDRLCRTLSLPVQAESYFPYRGSGSSDSINLDLTVFDKKESEEQMHFVEKQRSHDDQFDTVNINTEILDGATNLAFLLESPVAQCSQGDNGDEDESDGEKYGISTFLSTKDIANHRLTLNEKGRTRCLLRQQSATAQTEADMNKPNKLHNVWYSLDESTSENLPLTISNMHLKKHYNEHAPSSKVKLNFQEGKTNLEEAILPSSGSRECPDDSDKDEDRLSLEFCLPGKHKYLRLHRRTFIHFVLKYSIFFFTFLFWVASISGIGFGTWMLTSSTVIIDDISDVFLDPYVLLCVVSGIIFLVAFFGCVGALRENICLLQLFHISLTAVLVLEVLLSALVFLFYTMPEFRMVVKVGPEDVLKKAVKEYFDNEVLRNWIDMVQKEFQCCGVSMSDHGYLDWQDNLYYNCSTSNPSVYRCSVPLSCCIFMPGEYINYMCGADILKKKESDILNIINTKGCMKSFGEWLGKNDAVIGYVACGAIIPQILGVIATRFFIKNLRARRTTWLQLSDPIQIVTPSES